MFTIIGGILLLLWLSPVAWGLWKHLTDGDDRTDKSYPLNNDERLS